MGWGLSSTLLWASGRSTANAFGDSYDRQVEALNAGEAG